MMQLDAAVQDGLQFLQSRQMPSGQFPVEMTTISNGVTRVEPDDALFSTAHIIYSIGQIPDPVAIGITNLGLDYFQNEMTGHGLWRHWNKDSVRAGRRLAPFIPADLDDMCCISYLLRRHGRQYPDNKRLVALNRNRAGLFYTWEVITVRATIVPGLEVPSYVEKLRGGGGKNCRAAVCGGMNCRSDVGYLSNVMVAKARHPCLCRIK